MLQFSSKANEKFLKYLYTISPETICVLTSCLKLFYQPYFEVYIPEILAFDDIRGLQRLTRPCFPVYERNKCKRIVPRQSGSSKATTRNPATTKIFLYTPSNHEVAEQLHPCGGGLPSNTTFDTNCPTEIFIHGAGDGVCRTAWMREMKEQMFLRSGCYNVILVDWTWGSSPDPVSVFNGKVVGEQLAYVLKKIARQTGYDCKKFHVVGHSFGAIAGSYTGKHMQKKCRLGRLTTLEEAVLPFLYAPEEEFVNPTDALFVDTVHSNAGDCFPFNIGDYRALGHVNFYMNDGTNQYSCYPFSFDSFLKLDLIEAVQSVLYPPLCSHNQAHEYYRASILANTDDTLLIGVQCDSYDDLIGGKCDRDCSKKGNCLPMGLDTSSYINYRNLSDDLSQAQIYFVPTTLTCPYADHSGFTGLPLNPITEQ